MSNVLVTLASVAMSKAASASMLLSRMRLTVTAILASAKAKRSAPSMWLIVAVCVNSAVMSAAAALITPTAAVTPKLELNPLWASAM